MSRLCLTVSLFPVLLLAATALSAEPTARVKGPITVTSESLTADNRAHLAVFDKNVIAKTADMTFHADRMTVHYKEQGGEVTRIEALGNVKVFSESKVITAQEAIYFAEDEKIVFKGNPRVVDGDNVLSGTQIIYYVKDDRSLVENSKVILKGRQER